MIRPIVRSIITSRRGLLQIMRSVFASTAGLPIRHLCLLILLLSGQAYSQDNGIRITAPTLQTVNRVSSQPASAEAFYVADLGAMVSGQVDEVLVDIGAPVKAGQVLARINVPEVLANIESQRASIDALESEYARIAELVERKSMAPKSAEEARKRLDSALAEFKRIEVLREYSVLKAPFDGIVIEREIDPGDVVFEARSPKGDDLPLMRVADIDPIRVVTYVPEKDAVLLDVGDRATVRFDALSDEVFTGTVSRKSGMLDPGTRSMRTEIDLPNPAGEITPGLYGRIQIELESSDRMVTLPASAIRTSGEDYFVYLVSPDNRLKKVPISIGADDGITLVVTSGLVGEEQVVDGAIGTLKEGDLVQIIK